MISTTTSSWDKSRVNQNPFMDNELNNKSHTKKLIEEFPTLSNNYIIYIKIIIFIFINHI